jgi:hypothetical protein
MFNCDNPNIIISDEGFPLQVLGPSGLRYKQGERWLRVSSEVLASPNGLVVYTSSIKKWESDGILNSDDERKAIVHNIVKAFEFRGIEIEVI